MNSQALHPTPSYKNSSAVQLRGESNTAETLAACETLSKSMIKTILGVICAATFLTTTLTFAQPTSNNPDPKAGAETTGTIKEYTPDKVLILDTLAPNEPTQFKLSKSVVYVDADGKTMEAPGLTTNQKVRVHYIKRAGENVADRVILIKE
jgi:hypothetical protein